MKSEYQKRYRAKVQAEAIVAYGGKCVICGKRKGLHLPRSLGNENYQTEILRSGYDEPMPGWNLCVWLKVRDWPKNFGFEVRCDDHYVRYKNRNLAI